MSVSDSIAVHWPGVSLTYIKTARFQLLSAPQKRQMHQFGGLCSCIFAITVPRLHSNVHWQPLLNNSVQYPHGIFAKQTHTDHCPATETNPDRAAAAKLTISERILYPASDETWHTDTGVGHPGVRWLTTACRQLRLTPLGRPARPPSKLAAHDTRQNLRYHSEPRDSHSSHRRMAFINIEHSGDYDRMGYLKSRDHLMEKWLITDCSCVQR